MNRLAININNHAITELEQGNILQAYDLLCESSKITMDGVASHTHVDTKNSTYRFHWQDCSAAFSDHHQPNKLEPHALSSWEGCSSFLFLRALRVTTPHDEDIEHLCPCGFAWVVWYNHALCCNLLGTRLCEKGLSLLKAATSMYQKVQRRIDSEPPSRHWTMLSMAVMNNQACIYHDCSMGEAKSERLEKLALTLLGATSDVEGEDWKIFFLNLQILARPVLASAA